MDDAFDEFKEGLISPLLGVIILLFLFVFEKIFIALKNVSVPNNTFVSSQIITPDTGLLFLVIFSIALTLKEAFTDIGQSYNNPTLGIAKIIGTIVGTIVFWTVLVNISAIVGSSQLELVLTFILAVGAPLFGILLKYKLRKTPLERT